MGWAAGTKETELAKNGCGHNGYCSLGYQLNYARGGFTIMSSSVFGGASKLNELIRSCRITGIGYRGLRLVSGS